MCLGRLRSRVGALSIPEAVGPARRAFQAAGESFRRADVLRESARCLRVALSLPSDDSDAVAGLRTRLAAALGELGNGAGALELCRTAAREARSAQTKELVADTTIGLLQGYSRKSQWRKKVKPGQRIMI